jgi:hypothetical protein
MIKTKVKCCRECQTALPTGLKRSAIFCGIPCKARWNNRRKNRGADLYDLWMAMHYDRDDAKKYGVRSELCRMAERWNDQDWKTGIQSYEKPGVVIARLKDTGRMPRARKQWV